MRLARIPFPFVLPMLVFMVQETLEVTDAKKISFMLVDEAGPFEAVRRFTVIKPDLRHTSDSQSFCTNARC